ncbi:MAG: BamA/TamA family outer membrane protein, partial [Ignavibacteriales bacterium]|nr:BamA/TamA family outer membrane protein [Ignavibacteriales bacterium]
QRTVNENADSVMELSLNAGERSKLHSIQVAGAARDDSLLMQDILASSAEQHFSVILVAATLNEILKRFINSGYPFAAFNSRQVHTGPDSLHVTVFLEFVKGRYCTIDEVTAQGNTETKDYVIARQSRMLPGTVYNQSEIDKIKSRVMRLRLFSEVSDPQYVIGKDAKGILIVGVKEKNNNTFDGIVGFMPGANADEKGYFTGMANIQMRNLFGTGRGAAIRWQKLEKATSELELQYLEPWLFNYPVSIEGKYFQRQQDSSYVQRIIEGAADYAATSELSMGVEFGLQRVIPTLREVPVFTSFNSSATFSGVRLRYDSRDDPAIPRTGLFMQNYYRFVKKEISGPTEYITDAVQRSSEQQKFSIDLLFIQPLFTNQVAALSVHGREMRGSMIETGDLFRLGGTNSLRGYRENQFSGSRVAWSNIEGRFFLSRRSYAFLFYDAGYYMLKANPLLRLQGAEEIKTGYGAGLVLESGLGLMNVSFALAKGDGFSQGKIHFGLVNEF